MPAATGRKGVEGSSHSFAITPHDTNELECITRGLLIAVGGTIKVTQESGIVVATTVPAGYWSVRAKIVWSTGTAATGITGVV